jgi:hypothetical protein
VSGFEGDVGGVVVGGFAVLAHVDAEDGEVAGMAGPFPVVGVAAVFTDAFGRGADESHVAVALVDEGEELVAFEQRADAGFDAVGGV